MKTRNLLKTTLVLAILFWVLPFQLSAEKVYARDEATLDGVERIEVEGRFCDVNIVAGSGDKVKFEGEIKGGVQSLFNKNDAGKYKIHHKQEGAVLKVWVDAPSGRTYILYSSRIEAVLNFSVPEGVDLDVDNTSGDISVEGITTGQVKLNASSGDIEVKTVTARLATETSSGDQKYFEIVGDIGCIATSGDIKFEDITGTIECRASSGDLKFTGVNGEIKSRTSSGDLILNDIDGAITNVSSSGDLKITDSQTVLNLAATSGNITGTGISLKGNSQFKTSSGDIYLDLDNDIEKISFDLKASSGDLRIQGNHADNKLQLHRGGILVQGVSTSGDQTYK